MATLATAGTPELQSVIASRLKAEIADLRDQARPRRGYPIEHILPQKWSDLWPVNSVEAKEGPGRACSSAREPDLADPLVELQGVERAMGVGAQGAAGSRHAAPQQQTPVHRRKHVG